MRQILGISIVGLALACAQLAPTEWLASRRGDAAQAVNALAVYLDIPAAAVLSGAALLTCALGLLAVALARRKPKTTSGSGSSPSHSAADTATVPLAASSRRHAVSAASAAGARSRCDSPAPAAAPTPSRAVSGALTTPDTTVRAAVTKRKDKELCGASDYLSMQDEDLFADVWRDVEAVASSRRASQAKELSRSGSRSLTPTRQRQDLPNEPASPPADVSPAELAVLALLNEGGVDDIKLLKGFGPKMAKKIIEHRETHGPLNTLDELVSKIGLKKTIVRSLLESGLF